MKLGELMDREKQFEQLEGLLTWYDEIINIYEAAFWVHYRILNNIIELWVNAVEKSNSQDAARVTYYVNTEYMSIAYSEMLLTIEVLLKAELIRAGLGKKEVLDMQHKIVKILDSMRTSGDGRCLSIAQKFDGCILDLKDADDKNAFVNARYIDYEKCVLNNETAEKIRKIITILDEVYKEYYSEFDIEHLLYLSMNVSLGLSDMTDDDKRRLSNLDILK